MRPSCPECRARDDVRLAAAAKKRAALLEEDDGLPISAAVTAALDSLT